MKNLKKILTLISCLAFALCIGVSVVSAAEEVTFSDVNLTSFTMNTGASIRKGDTTDENGIRFQASINSTVYETLEGLEKDDVSVNYGMVIMPEDMLPAGGFTSETLKSDAYHFVDSDDECACGKIHVIAVEYEKMALDTLTNLNVVRGSIINIKEQNLMRPFVGIGYIKYTEAGNTTYTLATGSGLNARSMVYVAQLAIDNGEDDAEQTIYNTYIAQFADKEFGYTVNHYLPDDTIVSEVLYGNLGEEVTATSILKGEDAEKYSAYKLYSIDTTKGTTSSVVYANGKTVLNVYYAEMDTSFHNVVNNANYYLMGANKSLDGGTVTWHDSIALGGETKEGVVQIDTTGADQYTAGKFKMALDRDEYTTAVANDWAYIKLHMYIIADESISSINFLSKNMSVATAETGKWVDVIVPLAKLNQYDTYVMGKETSNYTKEEFMLYAHMEGYSYNSASKDFLCTNTVKTGIGLTTTNMTYYIDDVSWGIDTSAPEITLSGIASEMNEGTWNEPTVTVTDDLALQTRLDSTIVKTLYKVVDGKREEVALTDGSATLDKGSYVYVVTADDRIYSDVVGNVATKEVEFTVVEKQDIVITFDSAEDVSYIKANSNKTYYSSSTYLDETALAAEGLNSGDIVPEGGAIKFVAGMENSTDANGTGGNQMYGAWLNLGLSEDEIALASQATSITFRMYVHPSSYPSWSGTEGYGNGCQVQLLDGNNQDIIVAGFDRDTWVDVTIDYSTFSGNLINYLNGSLSLWWTSTNTMYVKTGIITYYINSITFDVTP